MHEITIDDNLKLRALRKDDAEELFHLVDTNRAHLREWLPWLDSNTKVGHSRDFIRSVRKQKADDLGLTYAIIFHDHIAGIVGSHPIRRNNKSVGIGYWLSCEVTGQGIMTRCCRALVDSYEPTGPMGAKSVAEIGINAPIPTIANAIYDAVGVRLKNSPFTAERVLAALDAAT